MNHSISDLVSRIKNGYLANKDIVGLQHSKLKESVLAVLKEEGFILNYSKIDNKSGFKELTAHLKYSDSPAVSDIKVVSKPGRRVYCKSQAIPSVMNGLGITIISTSSGVMTGYEAKEKGLGGEVLLTVF